MEVRIYSSILAVKLQPALIFLNNIIVPSKIDKMLTVTSGDLASKVEGWEKSVLRGGKVVVNWCLLDASASSSYETLCHFAGFRGVDCAASCYVEVDLVLVDTITHCFWFSTEFCSQETTDLFICSHILAYFKGVELYTLLAHVAQRRRKNFAHLSCSNFLRCWKNVKRCYELWSQAGLFCRLCKHRPSFEKAESPHVCAHML